MEAARRQIDAAIHMLFSNEDPVAVHKMAMAALRIVRDLASNRGGSYMHKVTKAIMKPGMEKEFWRQFQAPVNFLKHADHDPDGFLENIDEDANDGSLFMACLYYQDHGHQYTPEMMTLAAWYMALHPEFFRDDAPSQFKQVLSNAVLDFKGRGRAGQLAIGQQLLEMARLMPRRY